MPDDLTPAEQARAARWAADVADEAGDHGTAKFFRRHAALADPPETVKSLRAERDAALTETIARLRATHVEAEAAWARCKPGAPDTIDLRMARREN